MGNKTERINIRVTKEEKEEIDTIIKLLNDDRATDEPKKTLSYAFYYLIDNYKANPNFNLYIKEHELNKKIKELNKKKEFIDFKINEYEKELSKVRENINKGPEQHTEKQIIKTPALNKAFKLLIGNCKQRDITEFEKIPKEMFRSVSVSCKVKTTDLIRIAKQEDIKQLVTEN